MSKANAVLCMVAGGIVLALSDALAKWLVARYPVGQIIFIRGIFTLMLVLAVGFVFWSRKALQVRSYLAQTSRAVLDVLCSFLLVIGLALLPLNQVTAIMFAGPIFIAFLASPLLGERISMGRWGAIVAGFAGVVIMLQPTEFSWLGLIPLGAAFAGALRDIVTRRMSTTDSSLSILLFTTTLNSLAGGITALAGWPLPTVFDLGLMCLAGLLTAGSQILMIEAFLRGEAALVAPFKYLLVIWAAAIGFAVWGEVPTLWTIFGAAIVIGCGIHILWSNRFAAYGQT